MSEPRVSSVDLVAGRVILADGQHVPITKYLGPADDAPADGEEVDGFDWVHSVVAGPDADSGWIVVAVSNEDKARAKEPPK